MTQAPTPDDLNTQSQLPAAEPSAAPPARQGRALSLVALLLALVAVLAAGASAWYQYQQRLLELDAEVRGKAVEDRLDELAQGNQQLSQRIGRLPGAEVVERQQQLLADVQGLQQQLSKKVDGLFEDGQQAWKLGEAEQLVRLASLRLSARQDVEGAVQLLQQVDAIVEALADPAAYATRQQLARSLESLHSLPRLDRTGLYLQLGALRERLLTLDPLVPSLQPQDALAVSSAEPAQAQASWWERAWQRVSPYVRIDTQADQQVRSVLSGQTLAQARLALDLSVQQAQWAVLNGDGLVYQQALSETGKLLDAHFNLSKAEAESVHGRLQELAAQPVLLSTPSLTPLFDTLQAYIKQRLAPAAGEAAQ